MLCTNALKWRCNTRNLNAADGDYHAAENALKRLREVLKVISGCEWETAEKFCRFLTGAHLHCAPKELRMFHLQTVCDRDAAHSKDIPTASAVRARRSRLGFVRLEPPVHEPQA